MKNYIIVDAFTNLIIDTKEKWVEAVEIASELPNYIVYTKQEMGLE